MKNHYKEGFTLIELLVVIAIIGILSAVVLTSLNTARAKGVDANIKANLNNIRPQSAIYYDTNNHDFTGLCADPGVVSQMVSANTATGLLTTPSNDFNTAGSPTQIVCHETADAWAANAPLKTDSNKSWCVDSTGESKELASGVFLAGTDLVCP